jgi:Holliday junction resolvase
MPHKNKIKGTYHERRAEEWLEELGLCPKRVPLSGSLGGEYSGDITLTLGRHRLVAEVKYRTKSGHPNPLTVLENKDIAIYRRKSGTPKMVVIMPPEIFASLLKGEHLEPAEKEDTEAS